MDHNDCCLSMHGSPISTRSLVVAFVWMLVFPGTHAEEENMFGKRFQQYAGCAILAADLAIPRNNSPCGATRLAHGDCIRYHSLLCLIFVVASAMM